MGWAGQIFRTARMGTPATAAFVGLGLAVAALTGLVAAGSLTSVDQYAVDHLMPALRPGEAKHKGNGYHGLVFPFSSRTQWWAKLLDVWDYPCSVLISALVIAVVARVLWKGGRPVAGLAWIGAWLAGNGIEVAGKGLISRPPLYDHAERVRQHVDGFDHAFPSGHSIRCVIVAGAVVFTWRRFARPVLVWALLVAPILLLTAAHTPSDVLGGGMVGLMLVLLAWAIGESSAVRGSPRRQHA